MIRKNKGKLLVSSLVILSPILAGLLLWNKLPDTMITHWGFDGQADGMSTKTFAIFSIPLILLVSHWFCILMTSFDKKNKDQNSKVFNMIFWIMPVVSIVTNTIMYKVALGQHTNIEYFIYLLLGIVFILIGNYLPKCTQNYTIGIKIKWTLENEENWNATHRFAGKVWVICGILLLLCTLLPGYVIPVIVMMITIFAAGLIPVAYSYQYHKKQVTLGTATVTPITVSKKCTGFSIIMTVLICIGVAWLLFTGDINVVYDDTSFTLEADFYSNLTVAYDRIETIEYITEDRPGIRTLGFGSPRLLMGSFENEEYGNYTRYSYVGCDSAVVLRNNEYVLVINGIDEVSTKEIYDTLLERVSKEN